METFINRFSHSLTRVLVAAFACVLLVFTAASPALAFGGSNSDPQQGTAQMNELQETSKRAVKAEPRDRAEMQRKAQDGINEVQGSANREQMYSSNQSQATSVRKQIENALEDVTGNS
jgi:signal transduction histidine kinase